MKTFNATEQSVVRGWYVVDASGQVLGRLAVELARRLRGKHKPQYTPHVDTGDYLVVLNAAEIVVTGRKREQKEYIRHTGFIGGLKRVKFSEQLSRHPVRILEHAVKGMLPRGVLGRAMFKKLKVFPGKTHTHHAQQPQLLQV